MIGRMGSIQKTANGRYRARYRDSGGKEHLKRFALKRDAQEWLKQEQSKLLQGIWVSPKDARITVDEWSTYWLQAYSSRRPSTVLSAETHIALIRKQFGSRRLDSIQQSEVKTWIAKLQRDGYKPSYIHALHARLRQLFADAIHDNLLARNPCSRRTAPAAGRQRPYVASVEDVEALRDALEPRYRAGLLLAALAGLRLAEVCGLKVEDVDFLRGVVKPVRQWPDEELKSEMSRHPIPIGWDLVEDLSRHVEGCSPTDWVMRDAQGQQMGPWQLQRAFRAARSAVDGLPEGFRFHDLRHFYVSHLIASGLDVKTVQIRARHASATTTLNTYGHLFPDPDEKTREAISGVLGRRNSDSAASTRPVEATVHRLS
jgi:integrase